MRFRVEVQRVWKIQFGRVLWGFRKSGKFKPQIAIFDPTCGRGLSRASGWRVKKSLELRFRVEVQRGLG